MTEADIPALVGIEAQSFYDAWNENMLRNEIANELTTYLVMECAGKLVGYAGFWLVAGEAQITRVAVADEERGQGYGTRLTAALVNKAWELGATAMTLEVREGNIAAQKPDEGDYEIDINETDWFSVATDGITFWYCKTNVEADAESPVLIKSCRPLDSEHGMDGSPLHFQLKVISSSIQAEPDRAVHEAWPAVKVSDGELVLVTSGVGN